MVTYPPHERRSAERKLPAIPPHLPSKTLADALDALGVVMDAYARQGHDRPDGVVTRDRRKLWAAANVIRRLGYMSADRGRPEFLVDYNAEPGTFQGHFGGQRAHRPCGRPTKKGAPCKIVPKFGRVACVHHATLEEQKLTYQWQASVHLPFPRVRVGASPDTYDASIKLLELIAGLGRSA